MFYDCRIKEIKENLYERYSCILLEKSSALTPYVNHLLSRLRAGGLIKHYWNDPLYLEQTLSVETFTFYDNSKDKLTFDTFFLIFIFLGFGMTAALLSLFVEILAYRYKARKAGLVDEWKENARDAKNPREDNQAGIPRQSLEARNTKKANTAQRPKRVAWARMDKVIQKLGTQQEPCSMYEGSDE